MTPMERLEDERDSARQRADELLTRLRATEAALERTRAELVRLDASLEAGEWMLPEWAAKQVLELCNRHMRDQGGDYPSECCGCDTESDDIEYHPDTCKVRRLAAFVGGPTTAAAMDAARAERVAATERRQREMAEAERVRQERQAALEADAARCAEVLARYVSGWVDGGEVGRPWPPAQMGPPSISGPASRVRRG